MSLALKWVSTYSEATRRGARMPFSFKATSGRGERGPTGTGTAFFKSRFSQSTVQRRISLQLSTLRVTPSGKWIREGREFWEASFLASIRVLFLTFGGCGAVFPLISGVTFTFKGTTFGIAGRQRASRIRAASPTEVSVRQTCATSFPPISVISKTTHEFPSVTT